MLSLVNARVPGSLEPGTVVLEGGIVTAVGEFRTQRPGDVLDCEGMLVLPGLIEPHLHLDKALLDEARSNPTGTLADAIAVTAELKASFSRADLIRRGRRVLDTAIANGTVAVRVHPDVDPGVGMLTVEAMLELKSMYAGIVDVQIVAFPQEGIHGRPGTLALLREALEAGVDAIGGCSYSEPTRELCEAHVDTVLDLAEEFGVVADVHADFADDYGDPRFGMAPYIARQVIDRALQGRVVLSHMTALAGVEPDARGAVIDALAEAGIAVVSLPATDLHLGGRTDSYRIRRGITPVAELRAAGVLTAVSSNNIRNAFTPYGNADQLETGLLLAQTAHLSTAEQLAAVVDMATSDAGRVLGLPAHGPVVGAAADLIVVDAPTPVRALLDRAPRRYVLKAGRVVAETRRDVELHYAVEAPEGVLETTPH